jgi:DinB superfamily
MTIPSGKGRNGDLSITIILLKSGSTLLASFLGVYHPASIKAVSRHCSPNLRESQYSLDVYTCADVWGNYIMRIIEEDRPTWRAVSPRTWIKQTDYPELAFRPSLRAFTTQRADLLAVLSSLPFDAWERSARVSTVGRVLEPTVLSYAERLVIHEQPHVKQIEHLVKTMQR